jgi:hypothetical protein
MGLSRRHLLAGGATAVFAAPLLDAVATAHADVRPRSWGPQLDPTSPGLALALSTRSFQPWGPSSEYTADIPIPVGSLIVAAEIVVDFGTPPSGSVTATLESRTLGLEELAPLATGFVTTSQSGTVALNLPSGGLTATDAVTLTLRFTDGGLLRGARVQYVPPSVGDGSGFLPGPVGRVVDTRTSGQMLGDGQERTISLPVHSSASAAVFYLTVTGGVGPGYLSVFPGGGTWPGTSTINWSEVGMSIATLVISAVGEADSIVVRGGQSATHFIIDYVGSLR